MSQFLPYSLESPRIPERLAVVYVALSLVLILMAYTASLAVVSILTFFAIWLPHALYKKTFVLRPTSDLFLAILFPLFCLYSVLWAAYPAKVLYTGTEFMAMVICAIIMARTVSMRAFSKGVTLGCTIALIITLINGNYAQDHFSKTYALVGLLGSKNQVGFIAEIGIYTGLLLAFTKIDKFQKLLFALIPLVICGVCLYMSRSATSVMSLTAMLSVLVGMYFVTRLPQGLRMPALVASIFAVATVIMFAVALDVSMVDTILGGFGKNSTLTGRTYLWAEGIKNGMEMPWLGHGYVSFWVVGQPQAELYWHEFLIGNRSGFHFHNLYVQTFVDLGAVGVTIVSLLLIGLCIASLRLVLRAGLGLETGLFLGLSFMFLVRSFAEVDILGPFGVGPLLFYAMIPQLAQARSIKNVVA